MIDPLRRHRPRHLRQGRHADRVRHDVAGLGRWARRPSVGRARARHPAVALSGPRLRRRDRCRHARRGAGGDADGPPARDDGRGDRGLRLVAGPRRRARSSVPGSRRTRSNTPIPWATCRPCSAGCGTTAIGSRSRRATTAAPTLRTLEWLGVAPLVDAIVCADDGLPVKPAPDMVLHVCGRSGRGRRDGPRSSATARPTCGWRGRPAPGLVIGVLTGVGERDDLEPLADLVIGSVEQLRIA